MFSHSVRISAQVGSVISEALRNEGLRLLFMRPCKRDLPDLIPGGCLGGSAPAF